MSIQSSVSQTIMSDLKSLADPVKAINLSRFFKTGPGQYGAGDKFWGISVPDQRKIVQKYWPKATLTDVKKLLSQPVHEVRLTALLLLVKLVQKNPDQLSTYVKFYLAQTKFINNWDLVDLSAPNILGQYLVQLPNQRKILDQLISSASIWDQRIAVLATFPLLKIGQTQEILKLTDTLLFSHEDLLHKAVGWMLRELSKSDWPLVAKFLRSPLTFNQLTKPRYQWLARTTLRYCLEKRPKSEYQKFLAGQILASQ
jgi:3-methyladenine DNA glycosylase AlkD